MLYIMLDIVKHESRDGCFLLPDDQSKLIDSLGYFERTSPVASAWILHILTKVLGANGYEWRTSGIISNKSAIPGVISGMGYFELLPSFPQMLH